MSAYETTPNGTRYKHLFSVDGGVLLVDGTPYRVGEACSYSLREFEVEGFNIAGTDDDFEVCTYDENYKEQVLFKGTEDECFDYVIDQLGTPNSGWEGFEGDDWEDEDEDELED